MFKNPKDKDISVGGVSNFSRNPFDPSSSDPAGIAASPLSSMIIKPPQPKVFFNLGKDQL